MDFLCGKRLKAILPEVIVASECPREIQLSAPVRRKLLAPSRRQFELRGRSGTRPGTLLKRQIPIRTFTERDNARPGFLEIDLVGHDGGVASGDFCQTLDVTDVASGWTETQARTQQGPGLGIPGPEGHPGAPSLCAPRDRFGQRANCEVKH